MAYERRSFKGAAPATTLNGGIGSGDASITLTSGTGYPTGSGGDFFIVVDRGLPGEEKIRCASRTGNTIAVQTSGRGADDTSAAAHSDGATVEHVITALDADEANYTVAETVGKVTAAGQLLVADGANSLTPLNNGTQGLPLVAGASTPAYGTLGSGALAADSVGSSQIAANAVGSSEIAAGAVGNSELATDAVQTANILDANVTTAKLASQAVTEAKLHTSVAGSGLAGGNGTALSVNVDGTGIEINADALRLKDSGVTGAKLNSAVVDDSTLEYNSGSLRIKDAGITSAKFNSEAATSWTPTVSGTGWGLVNGTASGIYIKHGRMVWAQGIITFGSSSTFGSGSLTIGGLPVAMNATVGANGTVFINDASTAVDRFATWSVAASASSGVVYVNGIFSAPDYVFRTAVTSTIPMTWANGDSLTFSLHYIAAS